MGSSEHRTANGTPFTVLTAESNGGVVTYGVANRDTQKPDIPLLIYAHGAGGNATQFANLSAWAELRDWIIDNGWAWVEASGGGEYSWGNQAARTSYEDAFNWVNRKLKIGRVVVLGRSMGGIPACWLATRSPIVAPRTAGLILNSSVTDLAFRYSSADEEGKARLRDAFNVAEPTEQAFIAAIKTFDPMMFPIDTWKDMKVLQLIGTNDTTVPPDRNAISLRARWRSEPALDLLDVRVDGDHSTRNGSYLQVAAMTTFLSQAVSSVNGVWGG